VDAHGCRDNFFVIVATLLGFLCAAMALSFSKSTKARPPRPSSKEEVMKWFRETELPKGSGLDPRTKQLADYFHGIIKRTP